MVDGRNQVGELAEDLNMETVTINYEINNSVSKEHEDKKKKRKKRRKAMPWPYQRLS